MFYVLTHWGKLNRLALVFNLSYTWLKACQIDKRSVRRKRLPNENSLCNTHRTALLCLFCITLVYWWKIRLQLAAWIFYAQSISENIHTRKNPQKKSLFLKSFPECLLYFLFRMFFRVSVLGTSDFTLSQKAMTEIIGFLQNRRKQGFARRSSFENRLIVEGESNRLPYAWWISTKFGRIKANLCEALR